MDIIERIRDTIKSEHPISSNSAKGIIELRFKKNDSLYVLDLKTPGYPMINFVGSYMLRGGNWNTPEDKSPVDTYARELREEFIPKSQDEEEIKFVKWVNDTLIRNAEPLWDYAYIITPEIHGNIKKGTMAGVESIFHSEMDGEELTDRLKISRRYGAEKVSMLTYHLMERSPESKVVILSDSDLRNGVNGNFGFGDEVLISRYAKERKGYKPILKFREGIIKEQISTTPRTPYADRSFLNLLKTNPLRDGASPDADVYAPDKK